MPVFNTKDVLIRRACPMSGPVTGENPALVGR